MTVSGPNPLDSFEAETIYGRTFFNLQKIIDADLKLAESDTRTDRGVLGAVVAQRVLLEAFPQYGFKCHTKDFECWKDQYLEWFDKNSKRIRMKKAERDQMRQNAVNEFDRIIELSQPVSYRFADLLEQARNPEAELSYRD